MKLVDAAELLLKIAAHDRRNCALVVRVLSRCSVGGHPFVGVKAISVGFDWDAGKVFIETDNAVTELTKEEVETIKADARAGQSWHSYQIYKGLTEENKKLVERVAELERQLSEQKAATATCCAIANTCMRDIAS